MRGRQPGDILLHPITLGAVVVVILNDRLLKTNHPSPVSGKLSDFAGLVMFPLMVVGIAELARSRWRDDWELDRRVLLALVLIEALLFTSIKVWAPAADTYRVVVGLGLWLVKLPGAAMTGGLPTLHRALHVEDPTDLIALVVLPVPLVVANAVHHREVAER